MILKKYLVSYALTTPLKTPHQTKFHSHFFLFRLVHLISKQFSCTSLAYTYDVDFFNPNEQLNMELHAAYVNDGDSRVEADDG